MRFLYALVLCCCIWASPACGQQNGPKLKTFSSFHGFWSIPLGTDFTSARISARSRYSTARVDADEIVIENAEFANRTGRIVLVFCEDLFCHGIFVERHPNFTSLMDSYRRFLTELVDKYDIPTEINDKIPLYVKANDDVSLERAIKNGDAEMWCSWEFLNKDGRRIMMMLSVRDTEYIVFNTCDSKMLGEWEQKKKSTRHTDY